MQRISPITRVLFRMAVLFPGVVLTAACALPGNSDRVRRTPLTETPARQYAVYAMMAANVPGRRMTRASPAIRYSSTAGTRIRMMAPPDGGSTISP